MKNEICNDNAAVQATGAKTWRIGGSFSPPADGANIWDYLPDGAHERRFASAAEATEWADGHSLGPDDDGVEPFWMATEDI